jgi:hypothetical protein
MASDPKRPNSLARDSEGWPQATLISNPSDRHYVALTASGGHRRMTAGVTSVTKETENVEMLKGWFLNKGLDELYGKVEASPDATEEHFDEETGEVTEVPLTKARLFQKARKAGPGALSEAGRFGNLVHHAIDAHLKGDSPLVMDADGTLRGRPIELEGLVTWDEPRKDEMLAALDLWNSWWSEQRVRRLIAVEKPLASETWDFAGTPDLVFEDDMGLIHLCDWKTSKRLYGSYLLQMGAYAEAMMEFGMVVDVIQLIRFDYTRNRLEMYRRSHPDIAWNRHKFLHSLAHWRTLQSLPQKLREGSHHVTPRK